MSATTPRKRDIEKITFERNTQFEELGNGSREVLEEFFLIVGVCFNPFLENLVLFSLATAW